MAYNFAQLAIKRYLNHYSTLPAACWRGVILNLIEATAGGLSFFLSIYFIQYLHLNIEIAAIIISCFGIGRILGGLLGGVLCDKVSPKCIAISSLLIQACTYTLLTQLHFPFFIAVLMFIQGIGAYGFQTSNNLIVINQCLDDKEKKLTAINILYCAANVGLGLSAIIVTLFASYGFHKLFIFTAALLFMGAIYMIYQDSLIKTKSNIVEPKNEKRGENIAGTQSSNKNVVFLALTCLLLVGMILAQLGTTYPAYIVATFPVFGTRGVGILFALNSIIIIFCQTPLINSFKNTNKIFIMGVGAFLCAFGMYILLFPYNFSIAVIACFIYTLGEMLFMTLAQLVCYDYAEKEKKGQSLGLYQAISAISMVVGSAVGGAIYWRLGSSFLWSICGIIGLFCFSACLYYKNCYENELKQEVTT